MEHAQYTNWHCPFQVYIHKELKNKMVKRNQCGFFHRGSNQVLPETEGGMPATT
jgi:hypothetical protein